MTAYPSMDWSAGSYAGPRVENEDYVVFTQSSDTADIIRKGVLLVVCDGSSSPTCGAQAARLAAHRVIESYYEEDKDGGVTNPQYALAKAVRAASRAVREHRIGQCTDMCTAICACAVFEDIAYIAQMGEIRAYSLRGGNLSYINELLKSQSPNALIEARYPLEPSDRIVLCSDGVYKCLTEDKIGSVLRQYRSPEQAVDGLIKAAIDANLQDNASAAVLNFNRRGGELVPANPELRRSSIWQTAVFLGVVTLAITLIGLLIFSPQSLSAMVGIAPSPTRAANDGVVSTRVMAVSTLVSNAETTPTAPATATEPATATPEATSTEAAITETATATASATASATETETATPTPTLTETPTPTETGTSTATATATSTSTATATATPTISGTRPTARPRPIIRRTATPVVIVTLGAPTEVAPPAQPTAQQPAQPPSQPPSQPDPTKPPVQPTQPPQPQPTAAPPPTELPPPTQAPPPTQPPKTEPTIIAPPPPPSP